MRVGGIYGLGRIAKDNAVEHRTVMELLITYLRQDKSWSFFSKPKEPFDPCTECRSEHLGEDRQAALNVLGRRQVENDGEDWRLEFREVDISGRANLESANLDRAILYHVNLACASLIGAHLQQARVSNVVLDGAGINGAWLNGATFARVSLRGAQLVGARLVNADLRYDVDLRKANLDHAELDGAHMENADLRDARLTNTCWGNATLSGALLDDADLRGADLFNVQGLTWPQLEKANWDNTTRLTPELRELASKNGRPPGRAVTRCEGGQAGPSSSPVYEGYYDITSTSCDGVFAWAWDMNRPNEAIEVDVYDGEGDLNPTKVKADVFRQDLFDLGRGDGRHGIFFRPPRDGKQHNYRLKFAGTEIELQHPCETIEPIMCRE